MAGIRRRAPKPGAVRFTPKRARNAVAVAKVLGPALAPVVLPFATRATTVLREYLDTRRAGRLGVPVQDLARYSGRGGALHARISGIADVLADVRQKDADRAFADETAAKLTQLTAAVRAAERMPTARRKAAHRAVAAELDQIEQRLLHKLGL